MFEMNADPRRIHAADEMWTAATDHLDKIIEHVRTMEPNIYRMAQENHDISVLFDWMKMYIISVEEQYGEQAHRMTMLMCAAAVTRLVRAPRTDDVLAQLDKELNQDDDH